MHLSTPFSSALISVLGPMFTLLLVRRYTASASRTSRLLSRHGIILVMACSTLMAMARMLLINAPQALLVPCTSLPATLWWALLWSLVVASFAGWLAWSWLNAYVGVPRTAPLLSCCHQWQAWSRGWRSAIFQQLQDCRRRDGRDRRGGHADGRRAAHRTGTTVSCSTVAGRVVAAIESVEEHVDQTIGQLMRRHATLIAVPGRRRDH